MSPHPGAADDLITSATYARITNVTPDTVRAWRRTGKITPVGRTASGIYLFPRADAERRARERRTASSSSTDTSEAAHG